MIKDTDPALPSPDSSKGNLKPEFSIVMDKFNLQDSTIKVSNDIGKVLFASLNWDNPTPTIILENGDATRSSWPVQVRTRPGSTVGIPLSYELISLADLINDCSLQVGDSMHIKFKRNATKRSRALGVYSFSITRVDNNSNNYGSGGDRYGARGRARGRGRGEGGGGGGGGGKEKKKRKGKGPVAEEVLFDAIAQVVARQEEEAEDAAAAVATTTAALKKANADKGNKRATRGLTKKEFSEISVTDDGEMEEAVAGRLKQQGKPPNKKKEEEPGKKTPPKKGKTSGGSYAALDLKRQEILSALSSPRTKPVNAPDLALYSQGHDQDALTPVELYERMKNTSGRLAVAGVTDTEWRWIRKHVPIKTNGRGYAEFHLPDGSKKLTSRTQAIAKIRAIMAKLPREELEQLEMEEMDEKYFSYSVHGTARKGGDFKEAAKAKLGENNAKRREIAKVEKERKREGERKRRQEGRGIDPDINLSYVVDERLRKRKPPPPPSSSGIEEEKPTAKKAKKKAAAESGGTIVKQEELEAAYKRFISRPASDRSLYMDVDITLLDSPTNLIGRGVNIYWPSEGQWFGGKVASYDASTGKHKVDYLDETEEEHYLAMSKIKALIDGDEVAVCLSVERVQELVAAWQEHCDVVKCLDKVEDADIEEDFDGDVVDYVKLVEEKVEVMKSMLPVGLQSQLDKGKADGEEEEGKEREEEEEEEEGKIKLPNVLPVIHPEPSQQQGEEVREQQQLVSQTFPSQQQLCLDQQQQIQLQQQLQLHPSLPTHKNFHIGDIVWCDFKEHPPWPCIVTTAEVVVEETIVAGVNPPKKAPNAVPVKLLGSNKVAYTSSYKTYPFLQGMNKAYSSVSSGVSFGGRRLTMNRNYKAGLVELYNWMQSGILPPGFKTNAEDDEDDKEEEEEEEEEEDATKGKRKQQQQRRKKKKKQGKIGGGGRENGPQQPKQLTPDGRKTKKQKTALATTKLEPGPFPITISPTLKVLSLGYIQWLHPAFHSKSQLWPVGYTIENKMASPASQKILTSHICQILEAEDGSGPLFKITVMAVTYECDLKDWTGSEAAIGGEGGGGGGVEAIAVVTGRTPAQAWSALQSTTADASNSNSIRNESTITRAIKRIGDNQFGLADSNIMRFIEQLDNVNKCKEYRPKHYKNGGGSSSTNSHKISSDKRAVATGRDGSDSGASTGTAEIEEEKMARVAYQSLTQSLPPGIKGIPYLPCGRANVDNVLQSHPCAVCGDDDEDDEDLLITCDCCNLMTHMSCYGINKKPDGSPWLCDACSLGLHQRPPPCVLCPVLGGPLKMTTDGRWCHRVCAAWMPETELVFLNEGGGIEEEKEKEKEGEKSPSKGGAAEKVQSSSSSSSSLPPSPSIFRGLIDGVNNVHSSRASAKTLKCSICKQEHGCIVQCCEPKCCVTVHAMCAQQSPFCGWKLIQDEDCVYLDSDEEEDAEEEEGEKKKEKKGSTARKKAGSPAKKKAKTQDAMEEANAARDNDVGVGGTQIDRKGKDPPADAVVDDGNVDEDAGAKTVVQKNKKQNDSNEEGGGGVEGGKANPPASAAAAWTSTQTPAFTDGLGGGGDPEERIIFSPTSIKRKKNLAKRDIKEGISVGNGLKLLVFCSKHGAQRMPGFARRQGALKGAAAGDGGPLLPHAVAVLRHPVHGLSRNPTPVSQPKPSSRLGGGGGGGGGGPGGGKNTTTNGPNSQLEALLQRYGASRAMPYNQATRRGHRAPEAMAAAEAKKRFVTALPLKLGGPRGMYSLPVLPSSRCIIHGVIIINNSSSDEGAKKLQPLDPVDEEDGEEEKGAAAAAAAAVALKVKSSKKNDNDLDKQLAIFRRLRPHPPSTSEKFAAMRASIAGRIAPGKSAIHGWGMFALLPHGAHEFVIEYAGELVRPSVSDHREETLYNGMVGAGTYIFRLNSHHHVDATRTGNLAHLINHSCDPNCYSRTLTIKDAKTGVVADHVVIIAKRDIDPGEELTYDYRFAGAEELLCNCGAAKCRGVVNVRQREADEAVVVPKDEVMKVSIKEIIEGFEEEEMMKKRKKKRKGEKDH